MLATAFALCACSNKGESSKDDDTTQKRVSGSGPTDSPRRQLRSNQRRLPPPKPITVEEAEAAIALPEAARVLAKPSLVNRNRMARASYCIDGIADVNVALERFTAKLKATGWERVQLGPKRTEKRRGASGQRGMLRAAIMAQLSEYPECSASKKQTRIMVTLYKLSKAPATMIREALRSHKARQKAGAAGATPATNGKPSEKARPPAAPSTTPK